MTRHHAFASSDGEGRNKTPDWADDTTCKAEEREQRAQKAMIAKLADDEAKQQDRSYNRKRTHRPDS